MDLRRPPDITDLQRARDRLNGRVHATAARRFPELDEALGCEIVLKCEQEQPTGAFKLRGATNAVVRLREQNVEGDVATHSSGNHGAALAWAAREDGRTAWVVMPENAVPAKVEAVRRFGGEVVFCAPGQAPREAGMRELVARGHHPIPPYDHPDIIAGQGTTALELLEQAPGLDCLVTPLGGGGLLAGCALGARHTAPGIEVWGAEPAGAADGAASLDQGERVETWSPDTVADGLRAIIGELTFPIIRSHAAGVLLADDEAIVDAMRLVFGTTGLRIEPSSAVALAVLREHPETFRGKRVGVVITGGNIDFERFPWLATKAVDP